MDHKHWSPAGNRLLAKSAFAHLFFLRTFCLKLMTFWHKNNIIHFGLLNSLSVISAVSNYVQHLHSYLHDVSRVCATDTMLCLIWLYKELNFTSPSCPCENTKMILEQKFVASFFFWKKKLPSEIQWVGYWRKLSGKTEKSMMYQKAY